jgi:hypothetical protein
VILGGDPKSLEKLKQKESGVNRCSCFVQQYRHLKSGGTLQLVEATRDTYSGGDEQMFGAK